MSEPLRSIRRRLTAWNAGVFALLLLLFGGALYAVVTREVSAQLDQSLESAAREIERAVWIRERESAHASGQVVDALEELRIPGRALYVFDDQGRPLHPLDAEPWIGEAARRALDRGQAWIRHEGGDDRVWRLYARRFSLADGRTYVAVAVADVFEVEDRYRSLLVAFALAAAAALVLVGFGGAALASKAARPIGEALDRMRRFTADAAHELRTPVAVVRGTAEVALQEPRGAAEYETALRSIAVEAERLGSIVDKMFLLARADAGEWPVRRSRLYLDDVLQDAVRSASVLAREKGVALEIEALEEAPAEGDPDLVRQLFLILLDNAVQYTPAGGRVTASCVNADGGGRVVIADTGPGIEAGEVSRVFDRFHRAGVARGRTSGAGLGLAIARWIADVHGADIRLESAVGAGTRIEVEFPAAV